MMSRAKPSRLAVGISVAATICAAATARADVDRPGVLYTGAVSELRLPASALGKEWTGPTGLVVDDFDDLSQHPTDLKPVVKSLKEQLTPIGIVSTADFTYRKKSNPLHQVTLRLFLFADEAGCNQWWAKKYGYEGWEKHYTVVAGLSYDAVDSTQVNKRALAFGNAWITCAAIQAGEDHIKLIELYVAEIEKATAKAEDSTDRRAIRAITERARPEDIPAQPDPDLKDLRKGLEASEEKKFGKAGR